VVSWTARRVQKGRPVKTIPIGEFEWTDDYSFMRTLTCKNHPTSRYLTKNPYARNIHLAKLPEGNIERNDYGDCVCPLTDLVVIVEETTTNG
jgi:hypothetical protein